MLSQYYCAITMLEENTQALYIGVKCTGQCNFCQVDYEETVIVNLDIVELTELSSLMEIFSFKV